MFVGKLYLLLEISYVCVSDSLWCHLLKCIATCTVQLDAGGASTGLNASQLEDSMSTTLVMMVC